FGLEGLVGAVGPGVAVLLLLATPLLYSVPEALLVGELASMLPVEGGYYRWVRRAFNRFWGYWNGWLSWVYSLIDMAIYPVLFLQYLRFFAPGLGRFDAWLLALARAVPLVTAVYLLTVIPVLALTDWTAWTDGAWPVLAAAVIGPWLGVWIALAGMVSAFALFNALLLVYSRIPLVLAQDGLL